MIQQEQDKPNEEVKNLDYPSLLRQLTGEISTLISLSFTIRVFSIKWQAIRAKLDILYSGLIAANDCYNTKTPKLLEDLLSKMLLTVFECENLAKCCINMTFSGKLLMQSDLDLVISNLDLHLKTLSMICNEMGILSNGFALIVSKPGVGASKDEIKFYVQDLLTRIKIGDCEMKHQALVSLNEIGSFDERHLKIVVETDDLVLKLAEFLDSNEPAIQEEAVVIVGVISSFEYYRSVLVMSGVIAPLVRVIETGSLKAKQDALRSLKELTVNGDNAWALSAHGGVTALLGICSRDPSSPELAGLACWVLANLVVVDEIKRFMIEEGAIMTLIEMIKGRDEMGQISSMETIQSMASGDECVTDSFVKQGGVGALVKVLNPKSSVSFKSREIALKTIDNMCYTCYDYVNLLISYGFIDHLLFFLQNGDVSIQELTFKSASRLCGSSSDARKPMGDIGFMTEFVKFLEAKSYEIREMAAEALCRMISVPKNRKKFAQDDHNIGLVLELLDPKDGNYGNFKYLLSILLSISNCNNGRRKIAHSGHVKNIEKIADTGVSDAKKLVRKLSTNRFKSLLNGIWHS